MNHNEKVNRIGCVVAFAIIGYFILMLLFAILMCISIITGN